MLDVAADPSTPWGVFFQAGAAGVAVLMCYLFLNAQKDARADAAVALKDANQTLKEANGAMKSVAEIFSETTVTIHRECRESSERREQELHQLIRDIKA